MTLERWIALLLRYSRRDRGRLTACFRVRKKRQSEKGKVKWTPRGSGESSHLFRPYVAFYEVPIYRFHPKKFTIDNEEDFYSDQFANLFRCIEDRFERSEYLEAWGGR